MGQRGLFCAVGNRVDEPSREARGKPGGSHQSLPLVISPVQRNSRARAVDRAEAGPPLPSRFPDLGKPRLDRVGCQSLSPERPTLR